jgi:hypothetical protein
MGSDEAIVDALASLGAVALDARKDILFRVLVPK